MFSRKKKLAERSFAVRAVESRLPYLGASAIAERLAYASFVSLPHKLLYIEIPKAACTTIKGFLRDLCGAPPIEYKLGDLRETRRDMFIHVRSNVPLPSLLDFDNDTQREILTAPGYLRFTVVRNPYSRLVSAWRNKLVPCEPGFGYIYRALLGEAPPLKNKKFIAFEQFLLFLENGQDLRTCNPHWRRQADLMMFPASQYTHVGRLEHLQESFAVLAAHLRTSRPIQISTTNSSDHSSGSMNRATAERIHKLYSQDFEALNYDKESWRTIPGPQEGSASVPKARYLDEIIERNLVISRLYDEYESCYRFSLDRLLDALQRRESIGAPKKH